MNIAITGTGGYVFTDACLNNVRYLTGLKVLTLQSRFQTTFSDAGLESLTSLTSIEILTISVDRNIDSWLVAFSRMPKLARLQVGYSSGYCTPGNDVFAV